MNYLRMGLGEFGLVVINYLFFGKIVNKLVRRKDLELKNDGFLKGCYCFIFLIKEIVCVCVRYRKMY